MSEVIINVGISGAGKSTLSTRYIQEKSNYLRINRDDIRKTLVGSLKDYYQRKDLHVIEKLINNLEQTLFFQIYNNAEFSIIIDNTHLKQSYINRWLTLFKEYEEVVGTPVNFKFKFFDISLEEAKRRVHEREDLDTWGEVFDKEKFLLYIDKQYKDYQIIKAWLTKNYKDRIL